MGTLGFHPSASFPSLIIIPLLIHSKIIFGIFFLNEKYSFSLKNPSQISMLQSNPNFYGPEKSEIIHKYSLNPRAPPEQKYFITFRNIFATKNIFCFGQKWWFLQQLPFYLLLCAWFFLCIFTLVTLG